MLQYYMYLQNLLARPLRRDRGATAVEYGLIVALIAGFIATMLLTLGHTIGTWITNVTNDF